MQLVTERGRKWLRGAVFWLFTMTAYWHINLTVMAHFFPGVWTSA